MRGNAPSTGKVYQVDGAIVQPLPLQDNGIPLWIAGGGERKTLLIAAKYAQYTNFDGTPTALPWVGHPRTARQDLGRDFAEITRSSTTTW